MKIRHIETRELATSVRWNLSAMAEIIVYYPNNGADSDYSKNWVCACHELPLGEDYFGSGRVMCKLDVDKQRVADKGVIIT